MTTFSSIPANIPGLDLQVIYLAAGHTERGGTTAHGLVEGRENIQVIEDALLYLDEYAGLRRVGEREYRLGTIPLVVVDHTLDLAQTVGVINVDYRKRFAHDVDAWRGVCVEVHHNAPSTTAQGPMAVYFSSSPPSTALAGLVGGVVAEALGMPLRRYTNEQNKAGRGWGYYFLEKTLPLALILEMDELHNPDRARVIGDDVLDDIYGEALAWALMKLAGVSGVDYEERLQGLESLAHQLVLEQSDQNRLVGELRGELNGLLDEVGKLRERIAMLEARPYPSPYPVPPDIIYTGSSANARGLDPEPPGVSP